MGYNSTLHTVLLLNMRQNQEQTFEAIVGTYSLQLDMMMSWSPGLFPILRLFSFSERAGQQPHQSHRHHIFPQSDLIICEHSLKPMTCFWAYNWIDFIYYIALNSIYNYILYYTL